MPTMINEVLLVISNEFDHELIGNHYFGICGKTKKEGLKIRLHPPPPSNHYIKISQAFNTESLCS